MKESAENKEPDVREAADKVAQMQQADIIMLNADIERSDADDLVFERVRARRRHPNVILILTTRGGSPDAAYRIARCLQDSYEKFSVLVGGYCKSAGTLCVLGANEVIMADCAEIGPLDVQLYKKDELGELNSGLVLNTALRAMEKQAFAMYEYCMLEIETKGEGLITFKTATEIATKMVVGLLQPVYQQIDPMQLGEVTRSMSIARAYGRRLKIQSRNFNTESLELLIDKYPSHGFVIDRREAEQLFMNVRCPTDEEEELLRVLGDAARYPGRSSKIEYISSQMKEVEHESEGSGMDPSPSAPSGASDEGNSGGSTATGRTASEGEASRDNIRVVPKTAA